MVEQDFVVTVVFTIPVKAKSKAHAEVLVRDTFDEIKHHSTGPNIPDPARVEVEYYDPLGR